MNARAELLQILESIAFPAILAYGRLDVIQQSQVLSIQAVLRNQSDAAALARLRAGWRDLQLLSRMREWLFYGLLVCPGMMLMQSVNSYRVDKPQKPFVQLWLPIPETLVSAFPSNSILTGSCRLKSRPATCLDIGSSMMWVVQPARQDAAAVLTTGRLCAEACMKQERISCRGVCAAWRSRSIAGFPGGHNANSNSWGALRVGACAVPRPCSANLAF